MSAITTQAGIDELKKLRDSATLDEVKAELTASVNAAEADVAKQSETFEQEAKDFILNLEQHLTDDGKALYQKLKNWL